MKISKIKINNLRNHKNTELELNKELNVFYGLNGAGKTTILEGIAICGFSKSFMPAPDSSLINQGESFYRTACEGFNDLGIPYKVNITYEQGKRKQILSTFGDKLLPKDIIGEIPMIILSPDFKSITFGPPEARRQFIDRLLSQASKVYIEDLIHFKKALKQRNNLLNRAKIERNLDIDLLAPWTEVLIKSGASIISRRYKFIKEFKPKFKGFYEKVSTGKEEALIKYLPNGLSKEISEIGDSKKDIIEKLREIYDNHQDDEYRRGGTLFGPQKDEILIKINGGSAKEIASQGQHKSLLISIKFAEFEYLKEKRNETPVVLLDDIFSELDKTRIEKVFEMVWENSAQTFVTVTEADSINIINAELNKSCFFEVRDGKVG